jgi:ankyrin repeat protein
MREAKAKEAAKEPGSGSGDGSGGGSGSGLRDMGSIMAALNMPPPQQQQRRLSSEEHVYDACSHGHHKELQHILLQAGLEIDWAEPDNGFTAATIAAQGGHDECLAQLISKGANLLKASKRGAAPIHVACQYGRYTTVALLLDNGVDASLPVSSENGETPVMTCCGLGHVKILALLLDRGSDPNLTNMNGGTAAHLACEVGQVKCLQLLIKRGAKVNIRDVNGRTPLDFATTYKQRECEDLPLLNSAVGMNFEDLTPLSEADKVCNVYLRHSGLCVSPSNIY